MHESEHCVFLDSNVLFSATRIDNAEFLKFWHLSGITPVISQYVLGEVSRHVTSTHHRERLDGLLRRTTFVSDGPLEVIPGSVSLVAKDRQILATALFASMEYLVTGDINHFGHLYNNRILHTVILSPRAFLTRYASRFTPDSPRVQS